MFDTNCPQEDKTTEQSVMFANRLQKRFRHLKKWAQRGNVGAFRLYDRDIPEIPLVLDYYGDVLQPQEAALSGALYSRPYEKDEADEERWLLAMKESAALAVKAAPERIFLKQRQRQRGISQYEKQGNEKFEKIVSEGDLSFKVNLSDYLDTGLFPDRRLLRSFVRNEAKNKKVLNLFSYTGSFSVCAAAGGAASTDSVDLSNTYLLWARENFSLNGLAAQLMQQRDFFTFSRPGGSMGTGQSSSHGSRAGGSLGSSPGNKLIRADVVEFIKNAAQAAMRWDIIILDPPSFSNSKKMTGSFDLRRDYIELTGGCLGLLASGGKLIFSVNARQFKTDAEELTSELTLNGFEKAFSQTNSKLCVTEIGNKITDEDFRGKKTPKTFLLTKI